MDDDEGLDPSALMESSLLEVEPDIDFGGQDVDDNDFNFDTNDVVDPSALDFDNAMHMDNAMSMESSMDVDNSMSMEAGSSSMNHFLREEEDEDTSTNLSNGFTRRPKVELGSTCPICDAPLHKQHARDHVSWHFSEEIKGEIDCSKHPKVCPLCSDYSSDKVEAVARHLALYHRRLDDYLENEELVAEKRERALAKPQRVDLGSECYVCGLKEPSREHVSRHFMKELLEYVELLPDQLQCPECNYKGEKPQHLARHVALVHSKLDELLENQSLVEQRRNEMMAKPNKVAIGPTCPVCDQPLSKQHARVHVIWHFMEDLRDLVRGFDDPTRCELCHYANPSMDKMAKHLALGHSKLDAMLMNEELVQYKRSKARKKPSREFIGPSCPICDVRDPPRDHVARHFGDELRAITSQFEDKLQCDECPYRGEKQKNLELHMALVHGRLDRFLKDPELVQQKRAAFFSTPKKRSLGPTCPICDMRFTKAQNRDHVAWHFMDELRAMVQGFPDPTKCTACPYTSDKIDNLVKHIALGHSMLDELLQNEDLVQLKRDKVRVRPKKVAIGSNCPICGIQDPSREHVARHFTDELFEALVVDLPGDKRQCPECLHYSDKPRNLAIHIGLAHGKLDELLVNQDLIGFKRVRVQAAPRKTSIGAKCPVCDMQFTKSQNRDHVAWHFMEELRAIVMEFPDTTQCTQCSYTGDNLEKMVKHVALGHSMLDEFLKDEHLVAEKRLKALSKPKKVSIGKTCPICDVPDPQREHVARHFGDELMEIVLNFPDPLRCTECSYVSDKAKNVSLHIALVHNVLDQFLANEDHVKEKRHKFFKKPQKANIGSKCPICDQTFSKSQNRDHVAWHFMDELRDIALASPDPQQCPECSYRSDKLDNLVKHMALGHSKLDELLQDHNLVQQKRALAMSKPKKVTIGSNCPICFVKFPKNPNRDHVAWHFMDELRDFVRSMGSETKCRICPYSTDKVENLVKHYALGHSKLDELLQDEDLVESKRELAKKKPKKMSFGPDCPICGAKGRDRDHVSRHFMPELMTMVKALKPKSRCNLCSYRNSKTEYMAKHLALFHCKLDELMQDEDLVAAKKADIKTKPKKMSMGEECIVCGTSNPGREHVARHFLPELQKLVEENSESPLTCFECEFTSEKAEYTARHMALVHCKLEVILSDEEVVRKRIEAYRGSNPTPPALMLPTKILPVREAVRKSQRQKEAEERRVFKEATRKRKSEKDNSTVTKKVLLKSEVLDTDVVKVDPVPNLLPSIHHIRSVNTEFNVKNELDSQQSQKTKTVTTTEESGSSAVNNEPSSSTQLNNGNSLRHTLLMSDDTGLRFKIKTEGADGETSGNEEEDDDAAADENDNDNNEEDLNTSTKIEPEEYDENQLAVSNNQSNEVDGREDDVEDIEVQPEIYSQDDENESENHGSLLMNTLLNGLNGRQSPNVGVNQQVKIRRATKAKWQVKRDEEESYDDFPSQDGDEDTEACMIVPEISHILGEEEQNDNNEEDEQDVMIVEPQVIIEDEDNEDEDEENECLTVDPSNFHDDLIGNDSSSGQYNTNFEDENNSSHDHDEGDHLYGTCPVCDREQASNDHVARHFMKELLEVVETFDEGRCPQCNATSDDPADLAIHIALAHSQLQGYLADHTLLESKREDEMRLRPSVCPICEQGLTRQSGRDHLVWHIMDELKSLIPNFPGGPKPFFCPECSYSNDKVENVCRHLALTHNKLDMFLRNEHLVRAKRTDVLSKPKKVTLGSVCPICGFKEPQREHVARHFMDELMEVVQNLDDHTQCPECNYKGEKPQNLAKHIALVHSMLDEMLRNEELVEVKRKRFARKPKKVQVGDQCPICDAPLNKRDGRTHVIWHFMDDLREIVSNFPDPRVCPDCDYKNERQDKMARHVALGHSKLDELLCDAQLIGKKRAIALTKPKKVVLGSSCPICGLQFPNAPNRDHVAWHFIEELREMVFSLPDPTKCPQCSYVTDKSDNLVKHIALGHSKLDELMMDEDLVAEKRARAEMKPRKINVGSSCPVCDMPFPRGQNRDHVAWHFMDELRAIVNEFPDPQACPMCDYVSDKVDNLVKHVALGHSKLDELLLDEQLLQRKRVTALSKPKRFQLGECCPICDFSGPSRDHVARHFVDELNEYIESYCQDTVCCNQCNYATDKQENLAKHLALFHCKLDEYLHDTDLVHEKRVQLRTKLQEKESDVLCIVCNHQWPKRSLRAHLVSHFQKELSAVTSQFSDPGVCDLCEEESSRFRTSLPSSLSRHVALVHGKLEAFLSDEHLLGVKRAEAEAASRAAPAITMSTRSSRRSQCRRESSDL